MNHQVSAPQTKRLALQPLKPEDAAVLHSIYQIEGMLRYFPDPVPPVLEKVQRFILLQQAHWEVHGYGDWGISLPGREEIIGWAGLQYLPELDETEVGFLLDRQFWGKGFATEAARASLQFGFEQVNLGQIIALVHPENIASQRVIEKCGMAYQETLQLWGIELMRFVLPKSNHL